MLSDSGGLTALIGTFVVGPYLTHGPEFVTLGICWGVVMMGKRWGSVTLCVQLSPVDC